jgi:3-methyladenine DNA glycosylase/8-oxoguanine DNA glycosylase
VRFATKPGVCHDRPHMVVRTYPVRHPLDLTLTLAPLRRGPYDPTLRLGSGRAWRATRTHDGPAALAMVHGGDRLRVEAWGPGAERALDEVPALLGLDRDPARIPLGHPLIARLARRDTGIRIPRSGAVLESLIPAILEQKVTSDEAHRAFIGLIRVHGEPAPGPAEWGLRLPPAPSTLAALPYYAYHPFGVERRRAELIRRVAARSAWFEAIADLPLPDGYARLTAVPGIGPWTAAEVGVRALGDEDAVSVGDFHLPNLVAYALAGEPRGNDARMLELLEPYRGQRARVMRLLELSGIRPPRYGPRLAPRRIESF